MIGLGGFIKEHRIKAIQTDVNAYFNEERMELLQDLV